MNNGVTIVIPVKNESYIYELAKKIREYLYDIENEILVISGNKDKYKCNDFKNINVLGDSLERAILTGFQNAKYENIIVMDGDGQHPPQYLRRIYDELQSNDIVIASRFNGESTVRLSPYRKIVSRTFNFVAKWIGAESSDPMSGFFGVKKEVVDNIEFNPFKWKVLTEILLKCGDIRVSEIPYSFNRRIGGTSSTSYKLGFSIITDLLSHTNKLKKYLSTLITMVFLVILLSMLNINTLISSLTMIDFKYVILAILSYNIMSLLMSYRLNSILKSYGFMTKLKDVFYAHTFGMLSSNIGLGQIGYLATVPILEKNSSVDKNSSTSIIFGIQGIEMIMKGVFGMVSLLYLLFLTGIEISTLYPALLGISFLIIAGGLLIFLLLYNPYWLEDTPIFGNIVIFFQNNKDFRKKFLFITSISFICWLLRGLEWYFIGLSLGMNMNYIIYLALHPLLTAIKFIPLTPSNIGLFEFALIYGLGGFGFIAELSVLFGLLDRLDNVFDIISIKELWR